MFLKNYTSDVPVSTTIHRIQQVLIKCGVNGITMEYGKTPGEIVALTFHVKLDRTYTIRLPADVNAALEALWLDYVGEDKLSADGQRIQDWNSRKRRKKSDFREQAERTAWKLQQDWVEVQMSMIQMKQAEFLQVFVAYIYDAKAEKTFYQQLKDKNFLALPAPAA